MKTKIAALLVGALLAFSTGACADGEPGPAKTKSKQSSCEADRDCKGPLPSLCRKCADGKTHCARHVCRDHACAVETCPAE